MKNIKKIIKYNTNTNISIQKNQNARVDIEIDHRHHHHKPVAHISHTCFDPGYSHPASASHLVQVVTQSGL